MAVSISSCRKKLLNIFMNDICCRRFLKPLIRRPVAALNEEEFQEFHSKKYKPPTHELTSSKFLNIPNNNSHRFIQLEDGDERLGPHILKVKRNRVHDMKNPKILLEGMRLISDAVNANIDIKCIYFTKKEKLIPLRLEKLDPRKISLFKVSEKSMKIWSETDHSAGLIAIAKEPKDISSNYCPSIPLTVVINGIEDEGHIGTLIRSAAAAGVRKVIMSDSNDPWSPMALRAAVGSHFHVPIMVANEQTLAAYVDDATSVYAMKLEKNGMSPDGLEQNLNSLSASKDFIHERDTQSTRYDKLSYKKNSMLIITNNKPGNSLPSVKNGIVNVHVPKSVAYDSPALCGSIVLYEMKRQFEGLSD